MSDTDVDGAQPATVARSGGQLTTARVAAGLTVAEAARQLKLSASQVDALESGDYDRLPGPVFVRGFLRNYARLLKLDPAPLLEQVAAPTPVVVANAPERASATPIPFPGQRSFKWQPYVLVALLVAAALIAYEFYDAEPAPVAGNSVSLDLPQPKAVVESLPVAAVPAEGQPATDGTPPARGAAVVSPPVAAPTAVPVSVPQQPAPPGPNDRVVRMTFTRESWVEVRDRSGRVIFAQTNPPGSAQAISGQPPFRLVVGNAGGVRVSYNDRQVDLAPHTQVDVARLTLE
jgi:cytoskeleton protein RodZ